MEPAIALASDGFPATEQLILAISRQRRRLERGAGGWALLNRDLRPGAIIRQLTLAALLQDIAAEGPDALYTGPMALAVATAVRAEGGWLAEHDLAAHQTLVREPVTTTRLAATMLVQPPPSQAALALVAMRPLDELSPQDPAYQHHLVTSAGPWPSFGPGALEAVDVDTEHVAARDLLEMHHGPIWSGDTVDTLGDKDLVIGAVHEAVQHALMQPDLCLTTVA
jgi:gamma-glutamyltranspeptidase/glutathione hydrolase